MAIKRSFRLKLILSYVFVILISFSFIAFFLDKSLEENSLHNIQSSLITQARLIENQITADNIRREDISVFDALVSTLSHKTNCRITIIDIKGVVLADSERSKQLIPGMENHTELFDVFKVSVDHLLILLAGTRLFPGWASVRPCTCACASPCL